MIPQDVIDELYGGDPEDFVAQRTARMREARDRGDREVADGIGELRKPTVAAWAVNRLGRERPAEVERIVALGERLRAAQADLDTEELRRLRPERDAAVEAFTTAARFVADANDRPLSVVAAASVRSTAVAALADEKAAGALAGGALVRTLEYAGFGEVDLSDAVAGEGRRAVGVDEDDPADDPRGTRPSRTTRIGSGTSSGPDGRLAVARATDADTDGEARRRRRERLTDELARADQDLAAASLVEAERRRQAEKAVARAEELRRLLEAAQAEAQQRTAAAEDAGRDRETAAAAYDDARRLLDES